MNKKIKNVVVYCGASNKIDKVYKEEAEKLAIALADNNLDLVFGGGNIGLMGVISKTMKNKNRKVIGITTSHIQSSEIENPNVTKTIILNTLRERKAKMDELADAVVALPGGFGTIDEVNEMIALKQLGEHNKPIVLYNLNGFWDNLVALYASVIDKKFAKDEHINLFNIANTVEEVINGIFEEQKEISTHNWRL